MTTRVSSLFDSFARTLAIVVVVFGTAFFLLRKRFKALIYVLGAGIIYGFVATLAKLVIGRISRFVSEGFVFRPADLLTLVCVVALLVAGAIGLSLVQAAYAAGSPDLVVAALTVISSP